MIRSALGVLACASALLQASPALAAASSAIAVLVRRSMSSAEAGRGVAGPPR